MADRKGKLNAKSYEVKVHIEEDEKRMEVWT